MLDKLKQYLTNVIDDLSTNYFVYSVSVNNCDYSKAEIIFGSIYVISSYISSNKTVKFAICLEVIIHEYGDVLHERMLLNKQYDLINSFLRLKPCYITSIQINCIDYELGVTKNTKHKVIFEIEDTYVS